jgi:DMSO/TMAO reductase YedYZ molybdopterin-dependent catalytic subunit
MNDMAKFEISRRRFLTAAGLGASMLPLGGCDAFDNVLGTDDEVRNVIEKANAVTYRVQRFLLGREALAREYPQSAIRQPMRANGSTDPQTEAYLTIKADNFANYRLQVGGLVEKPLSLSLAELRAMPSRTQITRHDCVEGWSVIAKWTGVQLSRVLDEAKVKPEARYVLFNCYDSMGNAFTGPQYYYETIDMIDARHPQTILAYGINGETLPVEYGAPLRVRVERQLGYKMAKYIRSIRLIKSFDDLRGGKGGFWEDLGYDWYAGA